LDVTNGWLGINDKYWAATLCRHKRASEGAFLDQHARHGQDVPDDICSMRRRSSRAQPLRSMGGLFAVPRKSRSLASIFHSPAPAATTKRSASTLRSADRLGLVLFHHQAMFLVMDFFFRLFGNSAGDPDSHGIGQIVFFPVANKSYASMAKMKAVQPQMMLCANVMPTTRPSSSRN